MKKYILAILLFTFTPFCYSQTGNIDSTKMKTLRIDPSRAVGKNVSDVYEKVNFISLETTKQSMVGQISQLEVTDDRLMIFDMDTWCIFFFDRKGCYVNKISANQIGKLSNAGEQNPGNVFNGFNLTNVAGKNVVDISSKNSILRFDTNGGFLGKIVNKNITYDLSLDDGGRIIPGYSKDRRTYYEFAVVDKNTDTASYFPFTLQRYEEDDFNSGNRLTLGLHSKNALYSNYYSYDIFEINKNKVHYRYKILLPSNVSLPNDFISNPDYKQKKWQYIVKNKNVVYGISNMYSIGDYLYLKFDSFSQFKSSKKNVAYNVHKNSLISLQDLTPDSQSYFLPVEDSSCGSDFMSRGFIKFDGKNLYTSISWLCLSKFIEQNKDQKVDYPAGIASLLKSKERNLNPVLVMLTPRTK